MPPEKCPLTTTPCRHCSQETSRTEGTKIVKDGAVFKPVGRLIITRELGMFCNNFGMYCSNMKECPGSGVVTTTTPNIKKVKKPRKKVVGTKKKVVVAKKVKPVKKVKPSPKKELKQKKKVVLVKPKRVKRKKLDEQKLLEI